MDTLKDVASLQAELDTAKNLPLGAQRTAAYTKIQRRWAEDYMVLSMLACFANLVVSGSKVKHMNTAALANHRCYMEKASV
jgi:peptide/nickel transport system substrate-binding protein